MKQFQQICVHKPNVEKFTKFVWITTQNHMFFNKFVTSKQKTMWITVCISVEMWITYVNLFKNVYKKSNIHKNTQKFIKISM